MKFVIARRIGRRGEGLGNEMIAWAKGWIAAQELGAQLVGPSWGLNLRRYHRNFRSSRFDFVVEDILANLPHYTFTESDYWATGEIDFALAIRRWAHDIGLAAKRNYIVVVEGMWGGYPSIARARKYLLSRLLDSKDAIQNLYKLEKQNRSGKLTVAVHMRTAASDFSVVSPEESNRGRFNTLIPGDWYFSVCEALQSRFGDAIQFNIFTDKGGHDYEAVVRRFNPGQERQQGLTECSDLLAMSFADLRVCSVSSYSMMANFLSKGPYIWYEPQLSLVDGIYSLWGMEPMQRLETGSTAKAQKYVEQSRQKNSCSEIEYLGSVMRQGDDLPDSLVRQLKQRISCLDARTDLMQYGCVPALL